LSLTVDIDHLSNEAQRVANWRLSTLLDAGYPPDTAERIARRADVDLHRAVELLDHGCSAELAERILA
jgi:hypothetical protein